MNIDDIFDVAQRLLDCVKTTLDQYSCEEVGRACVISGEVVEDDCCSGQLTVTVGRVYPSRTFPSEDISDFNCQPGFTAVDYTVSVRRCAPVLADDGSPPSCKDLSASAAQVYRDARAVYVGVSCCLRELSDEDVSSVRRVQTFTGPGGGCVGSNFTVTVGFLDGCVCA